MVAAALLAGASSLAKSESMRTLVATGFVDLPPGNSPAEPKAGRLANWSAAVVTAGGGCGVAVAMAASWAARAALATNTAGVSGISNFDRTCSSAVKTQAVGTRVIPKRRTVSACVSTSTQTGSKQAVISATASSLASVVRSSVVLAKLHEAVKITSTGRRLISEARRAVARSGCQRTVVDAATAQPEEAVSRAITVRKRQIGCRFGIGITTQLENTRSERCIGRTGRRNHNENAMNPDLLSWNAPKCSSRSPRLRRFAPAP